jgi:transcriptional regulator with XRE-family HTH domain
MKYSDIGQKIREYRQKKKLTQQQLADSIGVTWEMVSRYERGDSSPLNRIDGLAKALNVSPFELLQEYYRSGGEHPMDSMINNVPLFTNVPEDGHFSAENTTNFYNAPVWITQRDKDAFAIESSIARNMTMKIVDRSILYISPNSTPTPKSTVLIRKDGNLLLDLASKVSEDVIGVVLAQEVRL